MSVCSTNLGERVEVGPEIEGFIIGLSIWTASMIQISRQLILRAKLFWFGFECRFLCCRFLVLEDIIWISTPELYIHCSWIQNRWSCQLIFRSILSSLGVLSTLIMCCSVHHSLAFKIKSYWNQNRIYGNVW